MSVPDVDTDPRGTASSSRRPVPPSPSSRSRPRPRPVPPRSSPDRSRSTFPTGSSTLDENTKFVLDSQVVDLAATFGSAYLRVSGTRQRGQPRGTCACRSPTDAVARYLVSRASTGTSSRWSATDPTTAWPATTTTRAGQEPPHRLRVSLADGGPGGSLEHVAARPGHGRPGALPGIWATLSYGGIVPSVILPSPTRWSKPFPICTSRKRWSGARLPACIGGAGLLLAPRWPSRWAADGHLPARQALLRRRSWTRCVSCPSRPSCRCFIVWFGIEDLQKVMFLFVASWSTCCRWWWRRWNGWRTVYLQTATTLGASRWQLIWQVLVPGSSPAIGEALAGDERHRTGPT